MAAERRSRRREENERVGGGGSRSGGESKGRSVALGAVAVVQNWQLEFLTTFRSASMRGYLLLT